MASLALALGCGDGKIKTYPVTGSVTVNGKPYPGARVMLVPVGGEEKFQKERPFGITDVQGQFELTTFSKSDGAPAGDYQVLVRTNRAKNKEQHELWGRRPSIHPKYRKPQTSGLTAKIEAAATELPPIEVEPASASKKR